MKYIYTNILSKLQTKFSKFEDLLLKEQQYRKENVAAHGFPGMGKDIDSSLNRPWRKLPNIRNFAITVMPYDWLFLIFNLSKRLPPKLEFWAWKNAPANRYIHYMFKRLRKQVELKLYDDALKTLWIVMGSSAYQAAAYNSVMKNWHRELPLWQVKLHLKKISKLVRMRATNIEFRRVYLHELSKVRPLGVPTIWWRVYLHMYNNLIVQWRLVSERNIQHGYLPGRGVITAWEELSKLLHLPNIYEADFKGFFNNVSHSGIKWVLLARLHMPSSEIEFITKINQSIPDFPFEEGDEDSSPIQEPDLDHVPGNIDDRLMHLQRYQYSSIKTVGVPQGAPTSCSLATLCLRHVERMIKSVIYADDLMVFPKSSSTDPKKIIHNETYGALVNEDKSGWLKKDGVWLCDSFKFLGIRCYPPKPLLTMEDVITLIVLSVGLDICLFPVPLCCSIVALLLYRDWGLTTPLRFVAATRKGANLEFSSRESFLSYLYKSREGILTGGSAGSDYLFRRPLVDWLQAKYDDWSLIKHPAQLLWRNSLTGWFLSRMFLNSWEIDQKANFWLEKRKGTWVSNWWPVYAHDNGLDSKEISVFTASSFASHWLMGYIRIRNLKRKR